MIDWSAGTYELTATQLAPAAERAIAAAAITPGEWVLDVACGTGNAAILAAMGGAQVVGVDLAERLLEVAAGRARAAGVEIDWRSGDALALPVEDDAFDAVLSVFGVIFAPAEPAVAELVRVAAPGGRIVLVTWTAEGAIAAGSGVLRGAMAEAGAVMPGRRPPADRPGGDGPAGETSVVPGADTAGTVAADGGAADGGAADGGAADGDMADGVVSGTDAAGTDAAGTDGAGVDAVRAAHAPSTNAPATTQPATRDWGDPAHLESLFAPHGGDVAVERYHHVFEAASVEAFADEWMDRHPMWLAGREVLGPEVFAALREPLVARLAEGNEDPEAFRAASVAVVAHVQLP